MGMGGGMGGNWTAGGQNVGPRNVPETADDELETLKREMDRVRKRIGELEKEKGGKAKG